MDPYGKKELLAFYDRHLEQFGDRPQALRWTGRGQELRYGAFLEITGPLDGREVLDFGCGKGDLLDYFKGRGIAVNYTGIDINENLLALARQKHGDGEFIRCDIEEETLDRTFDVAVICGVFNLRIAGIAVSLKKSLQRLFPLCREALHLNIPSTMTRDKDPDMYYADPAELLHFALETLSPEVALRHGPVANEIFLSVYNPCRPMKGPSSTEG